MKLILTVKQLIQILEKEPPKFPITFNMKNVDKREIKELVVLLKNKN